MTKALVTGGTGFIGAHVVKVLLERGHTVHTTVRSLNNQNKLKCLFDLQSAHPERLFLFEANLLQTGTFQKAMEGCEVVYHVASPFMVPQQIKDGQKEIVEPALKGTKNVLDSVNGVESVKRVVLTSSMAAVFGDAVEVLNYDNATLSENYWNETSTATNNAYSYSKVASEREAWKIAKAQKRWDLVVICPSLVLGPSLSADTTSGSIYMLDNLFGGKDKMGVADLHYPVTDVRDVAFAHVAAGETSTANGRYIITSGDRTLSLLEMANMVRSSHEKPNLLPSWNLPRLMIYAASPFVGVSLGYLRRNLGVGFIIDASRSERELAVKYMSVEDVVKGHYMSWKGSQKK